MGQIGKPHGTSGEVYVIRISDDPSRFEPGSRLLRAGGHEVVVDSARPHRDRFLVKFAGVDDREAAEELRGPLYVDASERRGLDSGEFWQDDLLGCDVVLSDGTMIGEVTGVLPNPAHDLLAVRTDRGERLIPAVKEIIVDVDVAARKITLDPPEGLLE